jgi:hypothetical protein
MNPLDNTPATNEGTVVGLFRDTNQAERAIRDLKAAGWSIARPSDDVAEEADVAA